MNGKSAKLLRKMKSTTSRDKRLWNSLSNEKRGQIRKAAAMFNGPLPPLAQFIL